MSCPYKGVYLRVTEIKRGRAPWFKGETELTQVAFRLTEVSISDVGNNYTLHEQAALRNRLCEQSSPRGICPLRELAPEPRGHGDVREVE
jgi:hypothetical protein